MAKTVCEEGHTPEYIKTIEYNSNIFEYNNSDYDTLVKNGVQFWIDNVTKKTMHIRVATKGHSSSNPNGYQLYNPNLKEYYDSRYVGFTIAEFNITLNDKERLLFNVFNIPRVIMDDPVKLDSTAKEYPHILPNNTSRTDYDWNDDGKGINNLYVNNTSPSSFTSATEYEQYTKDQYGIFWYTSSQSATPYLTPQYVINSSACVNDYLVDEETYDLLAGDGTKCRRGFYITSAMLKSTMLNEYSRKETVLSSTFEDPVAINKFKYIESNGQCISGTLYYSKIKQYIIDDTSGSIPFSNQINLKIEL